MTENPGFPIRSGMTREDAGMTILSVTPRRGSDEGSPLLHSRGKGRRCLTEARHDNDMRFLRCEMSTFGMTRMDGMTREDGFPLSRE
jgi:hypothetical protein